MEMHNILLKCEGFQCLFCLTSNLPSEDKQQVYKSKFSLQRHTDRCWSGSSEGLVSQRQGHDLIHERICQGRLLVEDEFLPTMAIGQYEDRAGH